MQTLHEYQLTPSEIIFLGKKPFFDPSESLETRFLLSAPEIAFERRMLAAALIANQEAGAFRLEVLEGKNFFGLLSFSKLLVVPQSREIEWRFPSLEAKLVLIASQLEGGRENRVSEIVYDWMVGDDKKQWGRVHDHVLGHLMARELLKKSDEREKDFFLRHFGPIRFSTPSSTLDLVSQAPVSLVIDMFSDFERTQPNLWRQLLKEIAMGVKRAQDPDRG